MNEEVKILTEHLTDLKAPGFIFMPCSVGDTVYFIKSRFSYAKSPMSGQISRIRITSKVGTDTFIALMGTTQQERSFTNCDIGKTVFLTSAEAQAALERMGVDANDKTETTNR